MLTASHWHVEFKLNIRRYILAGCATTLLCNLSRHSKVTVSIKTYKSFMIATWLSMTSWQVHTFGHITLCNMCPESITWRWFWRLSIGKGFILYSTCPFRTLALTLANTFLVFLRSTPFSKRVWVFDEFMLEVIFHVRTISYHTCDINEERNWASFNLMTMDYSTIDCCTTRYNFIIYL